MLLTVINVRVEPLIAKAVKQQAQQISAETVNEIVIGILSDMDCSSGQFAEVSRSSNGEIQSISANMQNINNFKAHISTRLQKELENAGRRSVKIALGTLLGNAILRDRGPKIKLRFSIASSVSCEIENTFASAGINQTQHSVFLHITASVYPMFPGSEEQIEIQTDFCISEEIIVGTVPNVFISKN